MTAADCYHSLAQLLEYPKDKEAMLASFEHVSTYLENRGIDSPARPFADFLRSSTLTELQEDFVATFDFTPRNAPYLGHHLYGDNQKKSEYMIKLKQEYANFDFTPQGCELPDHLSVLLYFLAHLASQKEETARREFIEQAVLPGMKKLNAGGEGYQCQWLPLFETAEVLLRSDCKEVSP